MKQPPPTPPLAMKIIEKEMKERTGSLFFDDCGLREIPREVFEMDWLTELGVTNEFEYGKQNKQSIGNFQEPNHLSYIPKEIARLKDLKKLHLIQTGFAIPTGITDIEVLSSLHRLEELDLENNQIVDIAPLRHLVNLKSLNLSLNEIKDISALGGLTKLQKLLLGYNNILDIDILHKLTNLKILLLSGNKFEYTSPLQTLARLEGLGLNSTNISDLAPLQKLTKLQFLYCSSNQIKDIRPLSKLTNLRELIIDKNLITQIEPISKMLNLKSIELGENPIKDCPPDVWQTNDIEQIRAYFEGQSRDISIKQQKQETEKITQELLKKQEDLQKDLTAPTVEEKKETIRKQLKKTTKELEQKQQTQEELDIPEINDVKLIFVGNSGAGKTQLSKYFETGKLDKTRETTHGIRLNRWLPTGKVSPALTTLKDKVAANIWDFGGQEYYHGTFRLFLSNFAVYILLWEKDTNRNEILPTAVREAEKEELQHYKYKYWLDNIRHYAPTSPIIILQNKVDKDGRGRVDTDCIKEYDILGDHYISLHESAAGKVQPYKWNFDLFCDNLSHCMQNILNEKSNQQKSIAWLKVRDAVVNATKGRKGKTANPFVQYLSRTGKFIRLADFKKACLTIESKLTDSELYTLPRWLHNSGLVIYFGKHAELSDKVYLDPAWVTEGIYKILNETVRVENGIFTKKDLKAPKGFEKETVLALMEEMEIIFEKNDEADTYVAPQYLPDTHPLEDLYAIAAKGLQQKAFFIRLPLYFFRKVLQRMIFFYGMSEDVQSRYYWKKGILFEKASTRVIFKGILPEAESEQGIFLIGAEPGSNSLEIQKEVFHIICEILEEKELSKIAARPNSKGAAAGFHSKTENWTEIYDDGKTLPPRWLKNLEVAVDGEHFVKYLELCKLNREQLVFIPSEQKKRLRIHDFEVLLDSKPQRPLKVFLSYSHKDAEFMNRLSAHLAPLRRMKKIEVWTDKAILAGDEWDAEIEKNLKDADLILFLVSADFVASSYIWEKEIPLTQKLQEDGKTKVIPIYLRPFDFSGLKPFTNQMTPQITKNKPLAISKWDNIDEAFDVVARDIRKVINSFN